MNEELKAEQFDRTEWTLVDELLFQFNARYTSGAWKCELQSTPRVAENEAVLRKMFTEVLGVRNVKLGDIATRGRMTLGLIPSEETANVMRTEELKPCPFCGKDAKQEVVRDHEGIPTGDMWIGCDCEGAFSEPGPYEECVKFWNTRPIEDALKADATKWFELHQSLTKHNAKVEAELETMKEARANMPKIVCFCGSSRFIVQMAILMWTFEKEGCISLGLHYMPPDYGKLKGYPDSYDHLAEIEGCAADMDELHKRKIDLADEIFVVNVGGYIGSSTRSEIEYAIAHNKPVKYLEADSIAREGE